MRRLAALAALALIACGGEAGEGPVFPPDYAARYVRVVPCRNSVEHFLHHIAIWADPASADAYREGRFPLPAGSVIVKEEFADEACSQRVGWTAMRRDATDAGPGAAAWRFQELDEARRVVEPHPGCVACHRACDARLARDGTCLETVP